MEINWLTSIDVCWAGPQHWHLPKRQLVQLNKDARSWTSTKEKLDGLKNKK